MEGAYVGATRRTNELPMTTDPGGRMDYTKLIANVLDELRHNPRLANASARGLIGALEVCQAERDALLVQRDEARQRVVDYGRKIAELEEKLDDLQPEHDAPASARET